MNLIVIVTIIKYEVAIWNVVVKTGVMSFSLACRERWWVRFVLGKIFSLGCVFEHILSIPISENKNIDS